MLNTLKRFVPMAEKIIPRRTTLSVLQNICIDKGAVRATDLEISLSMKIDSEVPCLIPLSIVKTIIKAKPQEMTIRSMSDLRFEIEYDDRSIEFVSQQLQDYPLIASEDHHSIGVWDKSMVMTMHSLTAFCSNDELRPAMTGIHIEQNGMMSMAATDGHILKKIRVDGEWRALDAILPKRLLQILPRMVKRKVEVGSSDSYIRLLIDSDIEVIVKPIEAQYPNIDRVIPHEYAHNVSFNRNDMRDLLAEARAFANKETKSVVIQFSGDQIHLQVDNIEEDIVWKSAMSYDGSISEDYKLAVNIDYFDRVLKDIVEDNVVCKLSDPADAMILHGPCVEKETLLLMPIRLQKEDDDEEA